MKKGDCDDCGICHYCDPAETCNQKSSHVLWRKRKKDILHELASPNSRGNRTSSIRGQCRQKIRACESDEEDIIMMKESPKKVTSKSTLMEICGILGVDQKILERFPSNGFQNENMNVREKQTATQIVNHLIKAICNTVCPGTCGKSPKYLVFYILNMLLNTI